MSWKRVLRAAVCLLVICCLVINISPLNARALTPGILISVGASLAVSAALIALGVQASSNDSTPFWDAVNQCIEALTPDGWFLDGTTKFVELQNAGMPTVMAVPVAFLEAVRSWLFDEGIVEEIAVLEGYWLYNGYQFKPFPQNVDLSVYPYVSIHKGSGFGMPTVVFSAECPYVDSQTNSGTLHVNFGGPARVYTESSSFATGWQLRKETDSYLEYIDPSGLYWSNYDLYGTEAYNYGQLIFAATPVIKDSGTNVIVSDGLTAGMIAPHGTSISDGYSTWSQGSTTVSGEVVGSEESEVVVYPLSIPSTLEDVLKMTQEQVWTGTTTAPPIAEGLTGSLAQTGASTFIDALTQAITRPFEWIWTQIKSLVVPAESFIGTLVKEIFVPFEWLWQQIKSLFVPTEDFLTSKVDVLCARFTFADSIVRTGQSLFDGLSGISTEPPVIYVDLGASEGPYDLGGKVAFVDLHWYSRYKPTVDTIISSFLWACFVWRLLIKLPGIINGASGAVSIVSVSGGKEDL